MPLTTLPLEMFERIAELVDPEDLFALRLVSRDIKRKAARTFAITHFSSMTIIITERDLCQAIEIAEQPELVSKLKALVIRIEECRSEPGGYGRHRNRHYRSYDRQQAMRRNRQDVSRLTQLLGELNKHSKINTVDLRVCGKIVDNEDGIQLHEPGDFDTYQVNLICQALEQSGLRVEKFLMNFQIWGLPWNASEVDDGFLQLWPIIFSQLKTLKLDSWVPHGDEAVRSKVASVVAGLPELRELELLHGAYGTTDDEDGEDDEDVIVSHILRQKFPKLERLHIEEQGFEFRDLQQFLKNNALDSFRGGKVTMSEVPKKLFKGGKNGIRDRIAAELAEQSGTVVELHGNCDFQSS